MKHKIMCHDNRPTRKTYARNEKLVKSLVTTRERFYKRINYWFIAREGGLIFPPSSIIKRAIYKPNESPYLDIEEIELIFPDTKEDLEKEQKEGKDTNQCIPLIEHLALQQRYNDLINIKTPRSEKLQKMQSKSNPNHDNDINEKSLYEKGNQFIQLGCNIKKPDRPDANLVTLEDIGEEYNLLSSF